MKTATRLLAAWLCVCATSAAIAQTVPAAPPEIVVKGKIERKSDWRRAEADHVVVYSKSGEGELKRITRNLELLHRLMARLYRQGDGPDDAVKLRITLVDSPSRLPAPEVRNARSQEGPFMKGFSSQRYYDPRETGEVLVMARSGQNIDLNTTRRYNVERAKFDQNADSGDETASFVAPHFAPITRPWEALLYSAFAQHFMLTYVPAPYPRWFLDGVGALFSTIDVQRNGAVDYAAFPEGYRGVFQSYGYPNVGDVLTGAALADPQAAAWSPFGAWLIAHYFLFSNPKAERQKQFANYMAAVRAGKSLPEAAKAFGDMKSLQRDIVAHAESDLTYARSSAPAVPIADPLITQLSAASGLVVEARINLEGNLQANFAAEDADTQEAQLFSAEAKCRGGHPDECLASADRVLAKTPNEVEALTWKGVALTDLAVAGPADARPARLAEARRVLQQALTIDGQSPLALVAYFQSFTKAGERVPEEAMRDMAIVIHIVPAAPAPRLYLAQELVRQGKPDLARRLLAPVLTGPYESPEKGAAEALFVTAKG